MYILKEDIKDKQNKVYVHKGTAGYLSKDDKMQLSYLKQIVFDNKTWCCSPNIIEDYRDERLDETISFVLKKQLIVLSLKEIVILYAVKKQLSLNDAIEAFLKLSDKKRKNWCHKKIKLKHIEQYL